MKKYSERRQIVNRVIGWADDISWARVRRPSGCAIHCKSGPIEGTLLTIHPVSTNFKSHLRREITDHVQTQTT